jgi:DNA-binding GntR family transcriptional regulator
VNLKKDGAQRVWRLFLTAQKIINRLLNRNFMERQWTIREEANALTCIAFRNGFLEELHSGKHSELLEKPELSRITDSEMKKLMIGASAKLAELLTMKETDSKKYWYQVSYFNETFCKNWDKKI